jgi:hypothetical protein
MNMERQDHVFLLSVLAERHVAAPVRGQGEIRRRLAYF